jgi:beta-galactosidase
VELSVNGVSKGKVTQPTDGYVYAFPRIAFEPGTIKAVGYKSGQVVCQEELKTAGPAKRLKLTTIIGPGGLKADHADVALIDVEVVDDQGQRCPTDEGRVDFQVSGPAIWRGGYNSGIINSTNNKYLNTECGINRVAVRSTLEAGKITVTATRKGLEPATVEIVSKPVQIVDGLAQYDVEPTQPPTQ